MTCSRYAISMQQDQDQDNNNIEALSCVFRAGREGASTDHDSILFDVNIKNGKIQYGTTNAQWYKLGIISNNAIVNKNIYNSIRSNVKQHTTHPDSDNTIIVTGQTVPNMSSILKIVQECHYTICPYVPFVGWDVVLTSSNKDVPPICILEINLSCNFFMGSFDKKIYYEYCIDLCSSLDKIKCDMDKKKKKVAHQSIGSGTSEENEKKDQ